MSQGSTSSKSRSATASQIAKDNKKFAIWQAHHHLVDGSYQHDLPDELRDEVDAVFDVYQQLPKVWVTAETEEHDELSHHLGVEFMGFLKSASDSKPTLFSPEVADQQCADILLELAAVFHAWTRLKKLLHSSRLASEADYASQVYNVLRVPAGHLSESRCQCLISLPQFAAKAKSAAVKNLNPKTIRPDGSLFVPAHVIQELWDSANAPYQQLCRLPGANSSANLGGSSAFKWQSTLCTKLPEITKFEIASTFWEDKKPAQQDLAQAYRQNRMATTAALRQLHSLHVKAPVFGLVWAEGTVEAHVDWWEVDDVDHILRIISAPYPGQPTKGAARKSLPFHQWTLTQPADIIQVYLLLRNLDRWTVNQFRDRVVKGIQKLALDVRSNLRVVVPWRTRSGNAGRKNNDGDSTVIGESISSSPMKPSRKQPKRSAKTRCT